MSPHPLTNFEIYQQKKPKFDAVYSRNDLSKIKGGTDLVNLEGYESGGMHWIALYVNAKNVTYFDSFGVLNIFQKKSENLLKIKI